MHTFVNVTKITILLFWLPVLVPNEVVPLLTRLFTLRAVPGWSNPPVTRAVQEPSLRGSVTVNSHLVQVPFVPGSFRYNRIWAANNYKGKLMNEGM